jgi:hypothetical protein
MSMGSSEMCRHLCIGIIEIIVSIDRACGSEITAWLYYIMGLLDLYSSHINTISLLS